MKESTAIDRGFRHMCPSAVVCPKDEIRTILYDAVEHVIFDRVCRGLLGEILDNPIVEYFQAGNAEGALCNRLLLTDTFLTPIAKFIQNEQHNRQTPTGCRVRGCAYGT